MATDFAITTDANGNGSVNIPNLVAGTLLSDHWVGIFSTANDDKTFLFRPAQVNGKIFVGHTQPAPGPLPILGAVAAFGYSRNLRKRIKDSKVLPVASAIE